MGCPFIYHKRLQNKMSDRKVINQPGTIGRTNLALLLTKGITVTWHAGIILGVFLFSLSFFFFAIVRCPGSESPARATVTRALATDTDRALQRCE